MSSIHRLLKMFTVVAKWDLSQELEIKSAEQLTCRDNSFNFSKPAHLSIVLAANQENWLDALLLGISEHLKET
jgi:hypothetical protein